MCRGKALKRTGENFKRKDRDENNENPFDTVQSFNR